MRKFKFIPRRQPSQPIWQSPHVSQNTILSYHNYANLPLPHDVLCEVQSRL